jgi:Mut7-C RNAse domain/Mut7-C ubiquitin
MSRACFRFYAELNDFLPPARRGAAFLHEFHGRPSVIDVADALPPRVREAHDVIRRCPSCRRLYWSGSHHRRMAQLVSDVLGAWT